MATSPGQRFVRRHDAARTTTANTTAADISYDTAVLSEGGYSWSSPEVTVDEAGLYLNIFDLGQCNLASTRAVGTLVPSVNTTDQTRYRATHRYLRNSGGALEGASIGMAILDLSASDDVKVRNPGVLTPTDSLGNYATDVNNGGAIQLVRLPAENYTHVERTVDAAEVGTSNINTTRPWVDASGTWTTITYDSEVRDDDSIYPGSGGDITLAASTKYLVVWGATIYSTDASRHTNIVRLQIGGVNVQSGSGYHRNTASQGTPVSGMYLHETGGSTETLRLQATHETEGGDAGTPNVSDAYLQVLELPSTAEWIHVDNGAADSLTTDLAGTTTWYDTPLSSTLRADGGSDLSLDGTNNAVQNDSGGSLPVLAIGWHRWDRDTTSSGNRKVPWSRWDNGGSVIGYGTAGAYSRGQQSSDDTWQAHYCSAATMDLATSADLSFQVSDPANAANSDMGIYASTSRYFIGVQVLNLDTLDAGTVDGLLADDIESSSEVTSPAIGQEHDLLANDTESASETSTPAVGQEHALTSSSVESASELSSPALSESHILNANNVESASEIEQPAIGQEHAVLANDVESASETTAPSIGQEHSLTVSHIESSSEVSSPNLSESHILNANDTESSSEVASPAVGQAHILSSDSVESLSAVDTPVIGQEHALLANDAQSTSEVSTPSLTEVAGDHNLLADDVESASETTSPALGQEHSLSVVSTEATSETSSPAIGQEHALISINLEALSELTTPTLAEVGPAALLAEDIYSLSTVSIPELSILKEITPPVKTIGFQSPGRQVSIEKKGSHSVSMRSRNRVSSRSTSNKLSFRSRNG